MSLSNEALPIITISREYGAGGRSIARALSEKLAIPWYDKDFVTITAQKSGYSEEDILKDGEEISSAEHILDSILNNIAAYNSSHDSIYKAQKESMLELAQEGPCIIVGRCGNKILREAGIKSFDVFLYADIEVRVERAKALVPANVSDVKKFVEKTDEHRELYYKEYAKGIPGSAKDYNLCLDTGVIPYFKCVDIIADLV